MSEKKDRKEKPKPPEPDRTLNAVLHARKSKKKTKK